MDVNDRKYLLDLIRGNQKGLFYFHEKYNSKVYLYVFSFVRNKEIAEEITSDVFLKIWNKRSYINIEQGIVNLLFKITKDLCRDYLRKVARNNGLRNNYIQQCLTYELAVVEDQINFQENLSIAKRAIDNLPPKCRTVFRLRYDRDMSLFQISNELNITISTVQKHLHKGTKQVRKYLHSNSDLVFSFIILKCSLSSICFGI